MSLLNELISSSQEMKQFLSCLYESKVEFARRPRRLHNSESRAAEAYLQVLNAMKTSVIKCNINCFKDWKNLIEYIIEVEDQETLNVLCANPNNPFRSTNLVILACEHNSAEILKYLFEYNGRALRNLSVGVGTTAVLPQDEDEACHNAFYYAIRSSNIDLLDTLIHKWPGDYFTMHLEELDEILTRAYEDIKIKNIPLSEEMDNFVKNQKLRFTKR